MGINQIHISSSPISPENPNATGRVSRASTREAIPQTHTPENEVKITVRSQPDLIVFHKINEKINLVAKGQRFYQRQLQQVNDAIEQMKTQLEKIMKQFPPYPPGSEDRIRALRAYAGCRKLIDQLTIPPPDEPLSQTMEELATVTEATEA
ncbi:MAG: hypothetical protein H6Q43_3232 [Deltaproteobacteria bacterium]|jgi:hypothetical protein|nr:hypothetical protein [Deltaproteobacteria bacterium]